MDIKQLSSFQSSRRSSKLKNFVVIWLHWKKIGGKFWNRIFLLDLRESSRESVSCSFPYPCWKYCGAALGPGQTDLATGPTDSAPWRWVRCLYGLVHGLDYGHGGLIRSGDGRIPHREGLICSQDARGGGRVTAGTGWFQTWAGWFADFLHVFDSPMGSTLFLGPTLSIPATPVPSVVLRCRSSPSLRNYNSRGSLPSAFNCTYWELPSVHPSCLVGYRLTES